MATTPLIRSQTVRTTPELVKAVLPTSPLEILLELIRRARSAETTAALRFIAVNDSHLLAPYLQSALWVTRGGVLALSGLTEVEANAPYVQWLGAVCEHLGGGMPKLISAADLPQDLASNWKEWFPEHGLWIPFGRGDEHAGGLLVVRELPWREMDLRLLHEWMQTWFCAYRGLSQPSLSNHVFRSLGKSLFGGSRKRALWILGSLAGLACPVRISVLTPGELVPANPIAIRAPFDGVIKTFLVQSNEPVKAGQPLFAYDNAQLASKLEVATEAWRTTEAEQRQYSQQAFNDAKARGALSSAKGNVEEKRLEVEFLRGQLERSRVLAPQDGIAFLDDASEWIGRPVNAGQRIMRLAEPKDQEIEAWLPVADAVVLPEHASAKLYLSASPLSPVSGKIRYLAYEPVRRPDGHYAYRVRATLDQTSDHRVGLTGTVRLTGGYVPLAYWVLRRPLAAAREFIGL